MLDTRLLENLAFCGKTHGFIESACVRLRVEDRLGRSLQTRDTEGGTDKPTSEPFSPATRLDRHPSNARNVSRHENPSRTENEITIRQRQVNGCAIEPIEFEDRVYPLLIHEDRMPKLPNPVPDSCSLCAAVRRRDTGRRGR